MNRSVLALALVPLVGCRTAGEHSLVSTSEVDVRVDDPRAIGETIHVDAIVVRPRGDARITQATIDVYADENGNSRRDPGEWSHRTVGRPDDEDAADLVLSGMIYPRRPRLVAELDVVVDDGLSLLLRWSIVDVRAENGP